MLTSYLIDVNTFISNKVKTILVYMIMKNK